jgi:hypothetical protein
MNAQLEYTVAQQHIADLHHAADRARRSANSRRGSRGSTPIVGLRTRFARLTGRIAPAERRAANDTARPPRAPEPVCDMSASTEGLRADVL